MFKSLYLLIEIKKYREYNYFYQIYLSMKKTILFSILALFACKVGVASSLISATPKDGIGKQVVCIHSCGGETKLEEGAFNLLYNASDGTNSRKKWVNTSNLYPWVILELVDIYTIDKIVFRDAKLFEPAFGNVAQYRIEVSMEEPENCMWEEVALKKRQGGFNTKELVFENPVKAKYIKFTAWPGTKVDGTLDNGVRIYGFDVYGTLAEEAQREPVSVGKTVLGFNNASTYYERPLNIIDGNVTNENNRWRTSRPGAADSAQWVVIDLEKTYSVDKLALYDAKTLIPTAPNISGYNVYFSTEQPDIDKIKANEDKNTCWTKVVDAYDEDRSGLNYKTDEFEPAPARYIKLEVPRSRATGAICIFQFEVYGEEITNSLSIAEAGPDFVVLPNPVKRGSSLTVSEPGKVQIYSLEGRLIKEQIVSDSSDQIHTFDLDGGIYLIRLINNNTSKTTKLIVE